MGGGGLGWYRRFAIASINYRLTDKGQWPDQINDCYAVRWVRKNAKKYNLDDQRRLLGHLGRRTFGGIDGTRPFAGKEKTSSRVQAVMDWYGPSELLTMPPNTGNGRTEADIAQSNGAKLLGATAGRAQARPGRQCTGQREPRGCALLIMHGTADKGVPLVQSEKLDAKLRAHSGSTLLALRAGHGGLEFITPEAKKITSIFSRNI